MLDKNISGKIHVLDLRVGVMMHALRPHKQDVTNIICSNNGDVFTSSNDANVSLCHWTRAKTFTEGNQPDYSKFKSRACILCPCHLCLSICLR